MPFLDNLTNVAFTSQKPVDKIVRVFTGSYDRATDVTGRLFTLAGMPTTTYFYRIAHGLPRPVACEMIDSEDGGSVYYDGGTRRIAGSDDTYVYIYDSIGVVGAGTVRYKVWCNWIDDYDSSNPSIESISYTNEPVQFDSRENYQKIADQDVQTFSGGSFGAVETKTILHGLGYTPNAKAWFEALPDEVWPLNGGGVSNPFAFSDTIDEGELRITDTDIQVTLNRYSGVSKRAWYRIYYDAN